MRYSLPADMPVRFIDIDDDDIDAATLYSHVDNVSFRAILTPETAQFLSRLMKSISGLPLPRTSTPGKPKQITMSILKAFPPGTPVHFADDHGEYTGTILYPVNNIENGRSMYAIEIDHALRGIVHLVGADTIHPLRITEEEADSITYITPCCGVSCKAPATRSPYARYRVVRCPKCGSVNKMLSGPKSTTGFLPETI